MISKTSKRLIIISSIAALTILLGIAIGQTKEKDDVLKGIDLFGETLYYVKNRYVEAVNDEKLFKGALQGLTESLDPESFYLDPDDYALFKKYGDKFPTDRLGINLIKLNRYLRIAYVEPGSPADRAGLSTGDYLIHIKGTAGFDLSIFRAAILLSGKAGTKIDIDIIEGTTGLEKKLDLLCEDIKLSDPVSDTFPGGILYISLKHFYPKDITALQKNISTAGNQHVLLDLRENFNGSLEGLTTVLDLFIDEGFLFSQLISKNVKKDYVATPDKIKPEKELNILINESTTHFAEFFAAVMSEKKLASTYGRQTRGLTGEQSVIPIEEKGALYITTKQLVLPSGNNIYQKGLKPDVEITIDPETYEKAQTVKSDKGIINIKDPMLQKVLELITSKNKQVKQD